MPPTSISSVVTLSLAGLLFTPVAQDSTQPSNDIAAKNAQSDKPIEPVSREENGVKWRELIVPDAKITIVHVRNIHLRKDISPNDSRAKTFWEVQTEMFELMKKCDQRFSFSGLYPDGVTDKYLAEYNHRLKQRSQSPGASFEDLNALLIGTSEPIQASGALAAYAISRKMEFNAGESYELHQRAQKALQDKASDADDLSLRQREDRLLEQIRVDFPQGGINVLTNLGAEHRLFDNVKKWNATHPDFQFSLIEVSPRKVREILDEIPKPATSATR
jgi:hypothetical protein